MGSLAGEPRANVIHNVHYMELHKKYVARHATSFGYAQEYSCAMCASIKFVKSSAVIYALVTCAPCQASSSSCSVNRRTYSPQVSSHPFAQSPLISPPIPSSIPASRASYPWCSE
jgi:hypothetical protein